MPPCCLLLAGPGSCQCLLYRLAAPSLLHFSPTYSIPPTSLFSFHSFQDRLAIHSVKDIIGGRALSPISSLVAPPCPPPPPLHSLSPVLPLSFLLHPCDAGLAVSPPNCHGVLDAAGMARPPHWAPQAESPPLPKMAEFQRRFASCVPATSATSHLTGGCSGRARDPSESRLTTREGLLGPALVTRTFEGR
jgi:hypothetical protein